MTLDLLDPSALIAGLPALLPGEKQTLNSAQDAIAALLHTTLVTLSFRLVGLEEASFIQTENILPANWNEHGPGYYSLLYKHDQSSLDFLIKLTKLGKRTVINAIALQADKLTFLDVSTDDFTSASSFPKSTTDDQPLVHSFISSNRVSDLVSQFKLKIISVLMPGLRKDGYTEILDPSSSSSSRPAERGPPPAPQPERPPDAPGTPNPYFTTPRNPLEIGRRDRDPFPVNPFGPPPLFSDGDGMFVGPNHPILNPRLGQNTPGRGPWGGDGYLPPLGAPPGARFDQIGPGPVRPIGRGRGTPRQFSYDPDNDAFMPPGMGDSFM